MLAFSSAGGRTMQPARKVSRRSFFHDVAAGAVGGALLLVAGPGAAFQRAGRNPGAGDADFANPQPMGDTFQSDPPPSRPTGATDRDGGPAADLYGHGAGRNRRAVQAARCTALRQRIARYQAMRPRTPAAEEALATLRPLLRNWRCG